MERVRPDMFDGIYSQLLRELNPRHPAEEFRRIFDYPWRSDESHVGLALFDGEQPVGFIGLIFSRRTVQGRDERFCNVTSLIAKESHRAEAAVLLFQLRSLRDYTITNLTCNEAAYRVFSRMGYAVLDDSSTVFYPSWRPPRDAAAPTWRVEHDPRRIRVQLDADHARILDDHLVFAEHLTVQSDGDRCYVVYTLGRRRLLPSARMHFISNPAMLARGWPAVWRALWRRHRAVFGECDSRLLRGVEVPGSQRRRLSIPRLFRSDRLRPEDIPNLYSELILLNLA